jgi:hypothetical protein
MESASLVAYQGIYAFLDLAELLKAHRVSRWLARRLAPEAAPAIWFAARPPVISDMGPWLDAARATELRLLEAAYGISAACGRSGLAAELLNGSACEAAYIASQRGQLAKVQWLIGHFAAVRPRECLYAACRYGGDLALVDWLVAHAPPHAASCGAGDAFRAACATGHLELARYLIRAGDHAPHLQFSVRDVDNGAVRGACESGHLAVVRWLVTECALTPRDLCVYECIAIRQAAGNGHHAVVAYLVGRFGAAVVCKAAFGAVCASCPRAVVQRVAGQLRVTKADLLQFDYLGAACRAGQLETAMWLADRYALTKASMNCNAKALLHGACTHGHLHVAEWLSAHFGDAAGQWGNASLLRDTCAAGHLATAQWAVQAHGANAPIVTYSWLADVCVAGHLATAQWLAATFALTECGDAPIAACMAGRLAAVRWLLSAFTILPSVRRTTHIVAAETGNLAIVRALTEDDPPTAVTVASEQLHEACAGGHLPTAKWLVARHAWLRPEERMWAGACRYGQTKIARWLVASFPQEVDAYRGAAPNDAAVLRAAGAIHGRLHFVHWYIMHFRVTAAAVHDAVGGNAASHQTSLVLAMHLARLHNAAAARGSTAKAPAMWPEL